MAVSTISTGYKQLQLTVDGYSLDMFLNGMISKANLTNLFRKIKKMNHPNKVCTVTTIKNLYISDSVFLSKTAVRLFMSSNIKIENVIYTNSLNLNQVNDFYLLIVLMQKASNSVSIDRITSNYKSEEYFINLYERAIEDLGVQFQRKVSPIVININSLNSMKYLKHLSTFMDLNDLILSDTSNFKSSLFRNYQGSILSGSFIPSRNAEIKYALSTKILLESHSLVKANKEIKELASIYELNASRQTTNPDGSVSIKYNDLGKKVLITYVKVITESEESFILFLDKQVAS